MNRDLDALRTEALDAIGKVQNSGDLESLRVDLLGRKGRVTGLLKTLGSLPSDQRKAAGESINAVKQAVESALEERRGTIADAELEQQILNERIDVTLPGRGESAAGLHPITRTIRRIQQLFGSMGFESVEGPEIEDDWHNFEALNIPASHPARAMQDTFYVLDGSRLLRTHTSPVQIRTMQARKPPIRILCPGRVYRRDFDRTHSPMFHQIEGLYVTENVSLADLKHDLLNFLSLYFEREIEVRLRPSFFPFTEPSAELDIKDENGRWLEIGGCGIVHPKVFESVGIDPERYSGYAFGMGVERLAMLRYKVDDLRRFFENDVRFLSQFH